METDSIDTSETSDTKTSKLNMYKRLYKESIFLTKKYPNHILVALHTTHKNSIKLDKTKYLLNYTLTLNDFLKTLYSRLDIDKNHVIYFKINNVKLSQEEMNNTIEEVYNKYVNNKYNTGQNTEIDNEVKNYIVIELCRYTKYFNKTISFLTFNYF